MIAPILCDQSLENSIMCRHRRDSSLLKPQVSDLRIAVAFDPTKNATSVHRSALPDNLASPTENGKRRNAPDTIAGGKISRFLGVNFCESKTRLQTTSGFFKGWRHRSAWTAPRSPEIHDYGQVRAADMLIEPGFIQFNGMPCEQMGMAFTAGTGIGKATSGQAINGVTARANDMKQCNHRKLPILSNSDIGLFSADSSREQNLAANHASNQLLPFELISAAVFPESRVPPR
jgi:hypothetical protein